MLTTQVTFSSRKQMQYYSNLIFNFRAKPSAAKSRLIAIFQSEFFLWFAIVRWSAVGDWFDIELHRIFRSKPLSGIWLNCLVFISIRGVGARLQQPRLNTLWQNASFGNEDIFSPDLKLFLRGPVDAGNRHRPAFLRLLGCFCWSLAKPLRLSLDSTLPRTPIFPSCRPRKPPSAPQVCLFACKLFHFYIINFAQELRICLLTLTTLSPAS